nr:hypothetical protein [Tanacetum cinerariifolium]
MLNKENYVPWSSRLLRYAKSRPNGKLIHNSIIKGPYVRRMILEPGDTNREVLVNKTFHVQTDDELIEKELKQIEADDQSIQTILLGLLEDIYAAVDRQNAGNLTGYNDVQNDGNQVAKNPRVQNIRNQNGLIGVPGNDNQNGNCNLVAARAEGNAAGHNGNQISKASTSGTQSDKASIYDSDGSAEVHDYENCDDNEIFNMFTQEEQYTELLEPIPDQHQVPQNDNNFISEVTSVEQSGETIKQHPANFEETRALYDSLY